MRVFQVVLAIITLVMALGMFGFNLWIAANFSKGLELPQCYAPDELHHNRARSDLPWSPYSYANSGKDKGGI